MKRRLCLLLGIGLFLLAACTPVSQNEATVTSQTPSAGGTTPGAGLPAAAVLKAQTWLAGQLNIPVPNVTIRSSEQVQWTDSCLNLGRPDEGCLQVITPGWLIEFQANSKIYHVHTNYDGSEVRLEEAGGPGNSIINFIDTEWALVSFGLAGEDSPVTPVLENSQLTLDFLPDGQATGSGGCNSFGAQYEITGKNINFSQLITTEMACAGDGIMGQEQQYYEALQTATNFELIENELRISYADGQQGVLNFMKITGGTPTSEPTMALTGTHWNLLSFGAIGSESPLVEGSTITLDFGEGGEVSGSGGCNRYGAPYSLQDTTLTLGDITSTLRACAEAAVTLQEQAYFEALRSAAEFQIVNKQQLNILYEDSRSQMIFSQTVSDQVPGEAVQIQSIQMLDSQTGWAVGWMDSNEPNRILQTTDGGATWADRTPPDAKTETAGPIQNPPIEYFASAQKGWVVYPGQPDQMDFSVWSTQDGGESWAQASLDLSGMPIDFLIPSDLAFRDEQSGWLLAHLGAGMSHDYFAVFTTQDGGSSWQRVADPDHNGDIQGCVKSGLVFTSESEGWLSGNCPGLMPQLFFYQTNDGGASWSPVPLPIPEGLGLGTGQALGDRCGIAQLARGEGHRVHMLLRCPDFSQENPAANAWLGTSQEAGADWQFSQLPALNGAFDFVSSNEGWFLGSQETDANVPKSVYHTTNGGQTWQVVAEGIQGDQIDFVDALNGWIVNGMGEPAIFWRSEDGGATWRQVQPTVIP